MNKFISIIICNILLIGCVSSNLEKRYATAEPLIVIVIQKLNEDTAFVGYPASKIDLSFSKETVYDKIYYVKDIILRNYADDDVIEGYRVEKIENKTYVYTYPSGLTRTFSCGQLIKN